MAHQKKKMTKRRHSQRGRYRSRKSTTSIPLPVIFLAPVVLFLFSTQNFFVVIFGTLFCIALSIATYFLYAERKKKIRFQNMQKSEVYKMDGFEFEHYLKQVLLANDYTNVSVTKAEGDYGVDLLATKNGVRYGIQAKRYAQHNMVGVDGVYQVVAGLNYRKYKCDKGIVVTTSSFTNQARVIAKDNDVLLVDGASLAKMIEKFQK